jgi:hypothetical protein
VALLALSCARTRAERTALAYSGDFPTSYGTLRTTPGGVRYHAQQSLDESRLDFVVQSTAACFRELFPDGTGECGRLEYPDMLRTVVVIGPWEMACSGRYQVLKVDAPGGCSAKRPPGECSDLTKHPCRWRSGVREGASDWARFWGAESEPLMIATPSLYMLSDALARYISGCRNPWVTEQVIQCARPRVPMLTAVLLRSAAQAGAEPLVR